MPSSPWAITATIALLAAGIAAAGATEYCARRCEATITDVAVGEERSFHPPGNAERRYDANWEFVIHHASSRTPPSILLPWQVSAIPAGTKVLVWEEVIVSNTSLRLGLTEIPGRATGGNLGTGGRREYTAEQDVVEAAFRSEEVRVSVRSNFTVRGDGVGTLSIEAGPPKVRTVEPEPLLPIVAASAATAGVLAAGVVSLVLRWRRPAKT